MSNLSNQLGDPSQLGKQNNRKDSCQLVLGFLYQQAVVISSTKQQLGWNKVENRHTRKNAELYK
jgi:hypothetical protein